MFLKNFFVLSHSEGPELQEMRLMVFPFCTLGKTYSRYFYIYFHIASQQYHVSIYAGQKHKTPKYFNVLMSSSLPIVQLSQQKGARSQILIRFSGP